MGHIQEVDGRTKDSTRSSIDFTRRYVVAGYTPAELFTIAGLAGTVGDYDDETLAEQAAQTVAPASVRGVPLTSVRTYQRAGHPGTFDVVLEYTAASEDDGPTLSFRVATQAVNRKIATGPIRAYRKVGTVTPPTQRGILQQPDKTFRGAEVLERVVSWTERHVLDSADWSIDTAEQVTLKVNGAPFRGRPAGSVLCVGVTADQRGPGGKWDVTAEFQYAAPVTNETLPGFANYEPVTRTGWEFAYPGEDHEEGEDPYAIYVAPVYESFDWTALIPGVS